MVMPVVNVRNMQKPQRPRKREEEWGSRHYDWKDWEKNHNELTGLSYNKLFDVYQRNENVRIRNNSEIQNIQEEIDKFEKMNRKQIEALREDYKVMMAYAYAYRLHSLVQDPDNDEIPLIRKRVKLKSSHQNPRDPDVQVLPDDILEFYGERPSSIKLPQVEPKWRPVSFSGKEFEEQGPEDDSFVNDPFPTLKPEDLLKFKFQNDALKSDGEKHVSLPPIGTLALTLSNWKTFGNQKAKKVTARKYVRNAMSEPPTRWRDRENNKVAEKKRPKSYVPGSEFSCKTATNNKMFYDNEAKKVLPKLSPSHRRLKESQWILNNLSNPLGTLIDPKKTTSAIFREYRKNQFGLKKGPVKAFAKEEHTKPTTEMFQNWIMGNSHD